MSFLDIKPIIHTRLEQLSPEWHDLHVGRVTSSVMDSLVTTTGKASTSEAVRKCAVKLVMQNSSGKNDEPPINPSYWMKRGLELEEKARSAFELHTDMDVQEVGFIERGIFGCSPDGLLQGGEKDLEIKCLSQKEHGWVSLNGPEKKHLVQIHSRMVIGGLDEGHYWGYHPDHDPNHFIFNRDEFTDKVQEAMLAFEKLVHETAGDLGFSIPSL